MIASIEAERRRAGASTPERADAREHAPHGRLGQLDWPVDGPLLYRFGRVINPNNTTMRWNGIGIAAPIGTPVQRSRQARW